MPLGGQDTGACLLAWRTEEGVADKTTPLADLPAWNAAGWYRNQDAAWAVWQEMTRAGGMGYQRINLRSLMADGSPSPKLRLAWLASRSSTTEPKAAKASQPKAAAQPAAPSQPKAAKASQPAAPKAPAAAPSQPKAAKPAAAPKTYTEADLAAILAAHGAAQPTPRPGLWERGPLTRATVALVRGLAGLVRRPARLCLACHAAPRGAGALCLACTDAVRAASGVAQPAQPAAPKASKPAAAPKATAATGTGFYCRVCQTAELTPGQRDSITQRCRPCRAQDTANKEGPARPRTPRAEGPVTAPFRRGAAAHGSRVQR